MKLAQPLLPLQEGGGPAVPSGGGVHHQGRPGGNGQSPHPHSHPDPLGSLSAPGPAFTGQIARRSRQQHYDGEMGRGQRSHPRGRERGPMLRALGVRSRTGSASGAPGCKASCVSSWVGWTRHHRAGPEDIVAGSPVPSFFGRSPKDFPWTLRSS